MAQKSKPVMPAGHQQQGMSENMNAVDAIITRLHRALVYHDQDPRGSKALLCRAEAEIVRLYPIPAVDGCLVGTYVSKEERHQQEQDDLQCILEYIDAQRVEDEAACVKRATAHNAAYCRRHSQTVKKEGMPFNWDGKKPMPVHARMPVMPGLKDVEDIGALEASRVLDMRLRLKQVRLEYNFEAERLKQTKSSEGLRHAAELNLEIKALEEATSIYPKALTRDDQNTDIYWFFQQFVDRNERWQAGMMLDAATGQPVLVDEGDDEGLGQGHAYQDDPNQNPSQRRRCLECLGMFWVLEAKRGDEDAQLGLQKQCLEHIRKRDPPCAGRCRVQLGLDSYDVRQRIADKEEREEWQYFTPGSAPVHNIIKLVIGDEKVCDVDGKEAEQLGIETRLHGLTDEQIDLEDLCFRREWDQARKDALSSVANQKRRAEPFMTARMKLRLLQGAVSAFVGQANYHRGDVFFLSGRKYVVASNEWMKAIDLLDANRGLIGAQDPMEALEMLQKCHAVDAWADDKIEEAQALVMKDAYKKRIHSMPLRKKVRVTFFVPFADKAITHEEYMKAWEEMLVEDGVLPDLILRPLKVRQEEPIEWRHDSESVHTDLIKRKKEAVATLRIHLWAYVQEKRNAEARETADRIFYLTDCLAFFGEVPDSGVPASVRRAARRNGTWFNQAAYKYLDTEARLGAYVRQFSLALVAYLRGEKVRMADANKLIKQIQELQMNLGKPLLQMGDALEAAMASVEPVSLASMGP